MAGAYLRRSCDTSSWSASAPNRLSRSPSCSCCTALRTRLQISRQHATCDSCACLSAAGRGPAASGGGQLIARQRAADSVQRRDEARSAPEAGKIKAALADGMSKSVPLAAQAVDLGHDARQPRSTQASFSLEMRVTFTHRPRRLFRGAAARVGHVERAVERIVSAGWPPTRCPRLVRWSLRVARGPPAERRRRCCHMCDGRELLRAQSRHITSRLYTAAARRAAAAPSAIPCRARQPRALALANADAHDLALL